MKLMTVEELKQKIDSGAAFNLIDVREPHEHAEFNVGGQLIPLGKIQSMQLDELEALKQEEIVLYCRSGNRSGQACMILETMGFTNVVNVAGGMLAWQEKISK
ncbi:MAG TPA: NADH oxidase [Chitinophagaceae bacterium]|nr:NADH oxidase [Chitinophagaceae bacterium]HCT22860.1 NADH oxidase [Chitinophagaceae bacterium]